jgi:hypothetical protein
MPPSSPASSGIPDDLAKVTGWFPDGHAGGPTGAEVPVAMLESMGDCLRPGGRLYLPTATIQDENRVLAAALRIFGAANLAEVIEREFPLPGLVAKSKAVGRLMAEGADRPPSAGQPAPVAAEHLALRAPVAQSGASALPARLPAIRASAAR